MCFSILTSKKTIVGVFSADGFDISVFSSETDSSNFCCFLFLFKTDKSKNLRMKSEGEKNLPQILDYSNEN